VLHSRKLRAAAAGLMAIGTIAAASAGSLAASKAPSSAAPHSAGRASVAQLPSAVAPGSIRSQAAQDGICDTGDACLWFFQNFAGSRYDNPHNDPNFINNRFVTAGTGQFSTANNNAESVWNTDPRVTLVICTGANYTGCGTVNPGVFGNLTATYRNNVESMYWADSAN